jgi:hypothetical protein
MSNKKISKSLFVVIPVLVVAIVAMTQLIGKAGEQERPWKEYTQTAILKTNEFNYRFSYPEGWFVNSADPIYVNVQNVAPSNARQDELPEGFVKVSFMLDPKADPENLLHGEGELINLNDITWRRMERSGEAAGDISITLETVHGGIVFRVYAYIAGTGGSGPLFERQLATVNQIIASLRIDPVVEHQVIPGAPTFPPEGKPQATPVGSPRVP